jgi:hypothetical protein
MTHASLLIDLRRQQRVCPRLLRVTMTYRAAGASLTATEELVRLPEDLAACVANCLDWGRMRREAGEWEWCAVTVGYCGEEAGRCRIGGAR